MGSSTGSSNLATGNELQSTDGSPAYAPNATLLEQAQAAHRLGQLEQAEQLYRQQLADHRDGEAAAGLGALLRSSGRNEAAGQHYRWALQQCAWTPVLLSNACNWLRDQGHSDESLPLLQQGLQRWPEDLHLRWGLVLSLHQTGQTQRALIHLEALLNEQGERPLLLEELVACHLSCGHWQDALEALKRLQRLKPNDPRLLQQELVLLQRLGRTAEAWRLLRQQTLLEGIELLRAKAVLLLSELRHSEALPLFARLTRLQPEAGDHWLNLAACQKAQKQIVAPLLTLQAAVPLHPDRLDLLQALGSLLVEHGRWNEGLLLLQRCADHPEATDVQQFNLQFAAAGNRLLPATALAERARRWEETRQLQPSPLWADHLKRRDPHKRLRIAYLSQDLHNHPVGRFLEPLLRHHDRHQVEVVGISCGRIHDEQSIQLQQLCDRWLEVSQGSDLAAARQIAELEADLLIELGGYTGGQRLRVLTARPAPIQLSYLGYFASTHLACIDGWIGDDVVFPTGLAAEAPGQRLLRLPRCYMAYAEGDDAPLRRTATDNRFRFGCFNHSRKLSDPCLDLFAAVLQAIPESLLVLKSQTFGEEAERERIRQRLMQRGIHEARLRLLERSDSHTAHLEAYGLMDAALDPIPYGGATTTAEALWMGVPVVSLAGPGMVGRLGAAVLAGAELDAAIATTAAGYIERAIRLAAQGPRLTTQRQTLRHQLQTSALLNGRGLAMAMEQLYRQEWQRWLNSTDC